MIQAPAARGSPHTHAGLASRDTARLQPPVPGCRLSGAVCGPRRPLDSALPRGSGRRPPARHRRGPASYSREAGGYSSARGHRAVPGGRESLAVTSGDKAPYGDGEGRRLATARGRLGEGSWRGDPPVPARGFCMFSCSHLPGLTFNGGASRVSHGRQQQGPCGPRAEGIEQQPAAPATHQETHHVLGWTPGAGGRGGSSHFTLFREYEFTCKSRGWAPSRPPGPLAVETGSRSCTKWEWGGVRDPEQPARGVTGCAFGWEAAGQESWGCRNLLKTPRLFFP